MLPHYFLLPLPDVRKLKRTIHIMHSKVYDIIDYKKKQIETGEGRFHPSIITL